MKIYYGRAIYDNKEISAVVRVLKRNSFNLIDGPSVKKLEEKIAKLFGKKYGLMVNSGSSANLLALSSFNLKKGSEIITPSLTFSTTVSPLVQSGLIPLFIDVEKETMQMNTSLLKEISLEGVSAICVPNLIGNVANWEEIYQFAKENNLKTIEDSADTIGYKYKTDK